MPTQTCSHSVLYHDTCDDATYHTAWTRPDEAARLAASTLDGSQPATRPKDAPLPTSFPGPLVMPDDALALDPDVEPQTLHDFINERDRNPMTPKRKVIYVFDAPDASPEVAHTDSWRDPVIPPGPDHEPPPGSTTASRPRVEDVAEYIEAFYQSVDVRIVKDHFRLVPWEEPRKGRAKQRAGAKQYIGLAADTPSGSGSKNPVVTRIRYRPSVDELAPNGQLNLNDLLDGLLEALPSDAYSAMLLMHHDLYEDDDDDFCCGRAYGKSRICVISTFRYHPKLMPFEGITLEHTWPNSHCRNYVDNLWSCMQDDNDGDRPHARHRFNTAQMMKLPTIPGSKRQKREATSDTTSHHLEPTSNPMSAAVLATSTITAKKRFTRQDWELTWLARACVVAVHELGHCFGIDHCIHYACVMQGTASVAEDTQQPPYLCPVCQAKIAYALAVERIPRASQRKAAMASEDERRRLERVWTGRQYEVLEQFCEKREGAMMFTALAAWLRARISELEITTEPEREEPTKASKVASYFSALVE